MSTSVSQNWLYVSLHAEFAQISAATVAAISRTPDAASCARNRTSGRASDRAKRVLPPLHASGRTRISPFSTSLDDTSDSTRNGGTNDDLSSPAALCGGVQNAPAQV